MVDQPHDEAQESSDDAVQPQDAAQPLPFDSDHLLLIVVGSHLDAELYDRPTAYLLKERIDAWFARHGAQLDAVHQPVVCSDIWYINQPPLHKQPTLSIGSPAVNALSAYLRKKLHTQHARKDEILIQLDAEFVNLRCSIWGMNHDLTRHAVDIFVRDYLHDYLRAVVTQVEPHVE